MVQLEGCAKNSGTGAGRALDEGELAREDGGDHLPLALVELPGIKILGKILARVPIRQFLRQETNHKRVRWCMCGVCVCVSCCVCVCAVCAMTCAHTLGGGWAAHALGSLTFPTTRSRSTVPPGMGFTEFANRLSVEAAQMVLPKRTPTHERRPTGIGQFKSTIAGELVQRVNHAVVRHPVGALVQTL